MDEQEKIPTSNEEADTQGSLETPHEVEQSPSEVTETSAE